MTGQRQLTLVDLPPRRQFLKWVGNKQRFAPEIVAAMPTRFNRYIEPFVGSGAVLARVGPERGLAGDILAPLIEIWRRLQTDPESLLGHYGELYRRYREDREATYLRVRDSYNSSPNGLDLLFLCRACYGGVVRFTREGKISTPIGAHQVISPHSLEMRTAEWRPRVMNTEFVTASFEETMAAARAGDVVYCDPPYAYSQQILYGSQSFELEKLWQAIGRCVSMGAKALLSLDGRKKSGKVELGFQIPDGLFRRHLFLDCGSSMLRRFQKSGETMEDEMVHDRLLLTW
jgi:DNA adenine methylase